MADAAIPDSTGLSAEGTSTNAAASEGQRFKQNKTSSSQAYVPYLYISHPFRYFKLKALARFCHLSLIYFGL